MDWLPVSAALLLTGALAMCLGGFVLPRSDSPAESLHIVQQQDSRWMIAAMIFFIGSICLSLGLPAIMTLLQRRGWTLGVIAAIVLEIGFIGTAGFAMLMGFFRALVNTDNIQAPGLNEVATDAGLAIFLSIWLAGFYIGELLLALALLRARTTPRWISFALIAHVLTFPVADLLPEYLARATALLLVLGFAGVAIQATSLHNRTRFG